MDPRFSWADIAALFSAIWASWTALAAGVFGTAASLWSAFRPNVTARRIWLVVGLVALFLSPIYAWREEYHRAEGLSAKLAALTKPVFAGKINFVGFGNANLAGYQDGWVWVTAVVTLTSTGAPSVADDYRLAISTSDGRHIDTIRVNPPSVGVVVVNLMPPGGPPPICLRREDALDVRTASEPWANNGRRQGHLTFVFKAPSCEFCPIDKSVGTTVVVTFKDSFGNEHSASLSIGREQRQFAGPIHFPGLHLECANTRAGAVS